MKNKTVTYIGLALLICACANTNDVINSNNTNHSIESNPQAEQQLERVQHAAPILNENKAQSGKQNTSADFEHQQAITLKQIMADPQWIGLQPSSPSWSIDGEFITFKQKRKDSIVENTKAINLNKLDTIIDVDDSTQHLFRPESRAFSQDGQWLAWTFGDSLFVKQGEHPQRILRQGQDYQQLTWTVQNQILTKINHQIVLIDPENGSEKVVLSWQFSDAPQPVEPLNDYLAEQQISLIDTVSKKRRDKKHVFLAQKNLQKNNQAFTPKTLYFNSSHRLVAASVSPSLNYAIVVTREDVSSRTDSDVMPDYIQDTGRIAVKNVRQRVADAKPQNDDVWLVNLSSYNKTKLKFQNLPGYNDDVLADVKSDNANARGEKYQVNRLPRPITLLRNWYKSEPSLTWHRSGSQAALMLEAWDNKDRWIVSVDFDKKRFTTQHRLHDSAWINYAFNDFGWLHTSETLYYLSEETGYNNLYIKPIGEQATNLTPGNYEVDNIAVTQNDKHIYFTANASHPGEYEVYRVDLSSGQKEQITHLGGKTEYILSPDESQILLTSSQTTQPPELYLKSIANPENSPVTQLTHTTSKAFKALPWTAPQIIPIPSTHADKPVYARLYLPENYSIGEPRRAVVFNHGAGYLQNAHKGWSSYFREFMFHCMLVQQGYVVLDMDYRASKGYGRDWRTAIYRQMGKPELEDLKDGVDWLVKNANVDRGRVGTYGGSYGGFLTFMALFLEPDLFQAGAALRPVSDWAHYNTAYTSNILNLPDIDPIAYERSSPIYFAEGLSKPLLINAPMVDSNVFFLDVVRLVQRLIELEKTPYFETAIYPVESHGFVEPSSWLDEYSRIYALFEKNL